MAHFENSSFQTDPLRSFFDHKENKEVLNNMHESKDGLNPDSVQNKVVHREEKNLLSEMNDSTNSRSLLLNAVQNNDVETVKDLLLIKKVNPNFNLQMISPICQAAALGNIQILNLLLDAGADPRTQNTSNMSWERQPIHIAASKGHLDALKLFVERGIKINQQDSDKRTPLHWVSMYGHVHMIKWMIDAGALVNASQADKFTPLHVATCLNHVEVCKQLLAEGADMSMLDYAGWTPLHTAVCFGYTDLVQLYLDRGANPCAITVCALQENTLHIACSKGNVSLIKLLLLHGVPLESVDSSGETPLHTAVFYNRIEAIYYLIKSGANVNAIDFLGRSPVDLAAASWSEEAVQMLIMTGGRVTSKTPFMKGRCLEAETQPQSLKVLSFLCIRQALAPNLQENARHLPLPQPLITALRMDDFELNMDDIDQKVDVIAKDNIEDFFCLFNFHGS
ncbi:ankyrin repeat and SOCS box protein 13 [Biomphalaria glabrata]|nr:ankyrin repeat and SOCS box protein 13-like [Biomphalaria glabrata]